MARRSAGLAVTLVLAACAPRDRMPAPATGAEAVAPPAGAGVEPTVAHDESPTPRPVAPVIMANACPFECCQYGAWRLRSAAVLRERPAATSARLRTVAAGDSLTADSGMVIVTRVGVAVVRAPYRAERGPDLAPGDSVLILDYLGEGFHHAWAKGRLWEASDDWSRTDSAPLELVVEPLTEWWAHVTSRDRGTRGWIDMRDTDVAGADACS